MKSLMIGLLFFLSLPALASDGLGLVVHEFTNATAEDQVRVGGALRLLGRIVKTPEFRERILSMTYTVSGKTYPGFTQTTMTPTQILQDIENGNENYPGAAGTIDLYLDSYYRRSSTVGYTSKSDKFIHMNRYIQGRYTSAQTAGNIFHEWMHKIGYDHSKYNNAERPHSVPYKLGYLVAEMVSKKNPAMKSEMLAALKRSFDLCHH